MLFFDACLSVQADYIGWGIFDAIQFEGFDFVCRPDSGYPE